MPAKPKPKANRHRSPGEGTFVTLPDGRVRAAITITKPDGTRGRKWFTAATRKEAAARVKAYRQAEAAGVKAEERLTVSEYVERWLTTRAPARGDVSTVSSYRNALARFTPYIGGLVLRDLAPAPIQAAVAKLAEHGYAVGTIRLSRDVLSTMLNDARRDRLITVNPVPDTTPPRQPRRAPPTFTAAQVAHILATAETTGDPDWPLWTVLLTTALRIGEALGLRWQDIDLATGTLTVDGNVTRHGGPARRVALAKNATSHRTVPLPARAVHALTVQRSVSGAQELVFPSRAGRPENDAFVRRRYYAALARAGVPQTKPHGGRHTAATLLLARGVSLKVVSDILGHSSIKTTADVYAHVEPGTLAEAMQRLNQAISDAVVAQDDAPVSSTTTEMGA